MRPAPSPATGKLYGLARVCRVWQVARAPLYWPRHTPAAPGTRRGPRGPCPDDALVAPIRRLLEAAPCPGAGYRKVWARLRSQGSRTSPRRGLRLMRAHGLLAPPRHGHPHGPQAPAGTLSTERVAMMWGTAMPTTWTRQDGQGAGLIAVAHCSAACVGRHAATQGTRFEALEPIRQGVRTDWGAFGQDRADGLVLRHAHGSQ
jgi:hypothetical protein